MGPGNRPLSLDWLEDFLVLAESGNFSRAANIRAIAQPAFSRHIRALEEWVGVELIDRGGHPATLTAAGQRFLPLLQDILASLEAARIKARAAQELAALSLTFAATHVLSLTFFPRWLGSLEAQLRLGPVQTMSDSSQACEEQMLQRKVQFVLCHGHAEVPGRLDDGLHPVLRLSDDVLVPVSAPGPDGQALHRIGPGLQPPILAYSEASGLGHILRSRMQALHGSGLHPLQAATPVFTAHHAALLRTMAIEGRGLAWLPLSLVRDDLQQRSLVEAGSADWQVAVEIRLYRQPAEMTAAAESIWKLALQRL
jgi:DNA-binding transcriptional LysR family regulator